MVEMHANDRTLIDAAQAGDIVALVGLKNVQTGHTLCDEDNPATLEPMVFPAPVISVAVAPKDKANAEKLGTALGKMVAEDPSFHVEVDQESGETILKGMGELHLDIKVDILRRTHGVEVDVGKPQVAYRETITQGGRRRLHAQEADGRLRPVREDRIHDRARRAGLGLRVRVRQSSAATCPRSSSPRSRRASSSRSRRAPLAGYPRDRREGHADRRRLPRGRLVGRSRSKSPPRPPTARRCRSAGPQLLEPIMKVDVFVPDANVGDVIGDLNRRRGMIKSQEAGPTAVRIKADVPLSEMFGYIGDLRTMTSGRGQYSMEFSHYAPCRATSWRRSKSRSKSAKPRRSNSSLATYPRQRGCLAVRASADPKTASPRRRRFSFCEFALVMPPLARCRQRASPPARARAQRAARDRGRHGSAIPARASLLQTPFSPSNAGKDFYLPQRRTTPPERDARPWQDSARDFSPRARRPGAEVCRAHVGASRGAQDPVEHLSRDDLVVLVEAQVLGHAPGLAVDVSAVDDRELAERGVPDDVVHGEGQRGDAREGGVPIGSQRWLATDAG